MVLTQLLSAALGKAVDKQKEVDLLGVNVKPAVNQAFVTSELDILGGTFTPRAVAPIRVQTAGAENSNRFNEDILVALDANGKTVFYDISNTTIPQGNGVLIEKPNVPAATNALLRANGYNYIQEI